MSENSVVEPKPSPLVALESLSKATALVLFVTYTSGFIIVSVHNASYGFTELSPFKPRILSAGVLFLVLVAVAVISARLFFSSNQSLIFPASLANTLYRTWNYFVTCTIASMAFTPIYVSPPIDSSKQNPPYWLMGLYGLLFIVLATAVGVAVTHYEKNREKHPWPAVIVYAVILTAFVSYSAIQSRVYAQPALTLWLFGIGLMSIMIDRGIKRGGFQFASDLVFPMVLALSIFPSYLYPRIKYSWGGGEAVPVVVYLSQESRLFPGREIEGQLLDESDGGFYLLQREQNKAALYIPRNAVSALYFSQSPMKLELPSSKPFLPPFLP